MSRRIGIDVGGTKCLGVVLDDEGTVVAEERRPTPKETDELVSRLQKFKKQNEASVDKLKDVNVVEDGTSALNSAVSGVEAAVDGLAKAGKSAIQPEVDAVKSSMSKLESDFSRW